jgi:hypothetical protein
MAPVRLGRLPQAMAITAADRAPDSDPGAAWQPVATADAIDFHDNFDDRTLELNPPNPTMPSGSPEAASTQSRSEDSDEYWIYGR